MKHIWDLRQIWASETSKIYLITFFNEKILNLRILLNLFDSISENRMKSAKDSRACPKSYCAINPSQVFTPPPPGELFLISQKRLRVSTWNLTDWSVKYTIVTWQKYGCFRFVFYVKEYHVCKFQVCIIT